LNTNYIGDNGLDDALVDGLKDQASNFLLNCRKGALQYRLTPASDDSPYALCFAVYLYHLIGQLKDLKLEFPLLAKQIVLNLREQELKRKAIVVDLNADKTFMQLLTFSLSALHLLDAQEDYPLNDMIESLVPDDIDAYLKKVHAYDGAPQSGNLSMFVAVLAIYGNDYLGMPFKNHIKSWVNGHLERMNCNGFWGNDDVTHLQFQNGFHQYEILEYLGVNNPMIENAVSLVRRIADRRGQFAPYPGGGGCYDYDAVSIITAHARKLTDVDIELLGTTVGTILGDQNKDGGFSESQWIRPRKVGNIIESVYHVLSAKSTLRKERARYFLALLSPKHDRIHTHWSDYSRHWSESDLWDTWFRLLTLARIDCAINPSNHDRWGFIDFPGIGYCAR
jgi:hypothetical protein